MAVSKRLRFEIFRRDNHACRYCGGVAPDIELTIDHVIPVALGGTDEPSNLVTACRPCNSGKSSVPAGAPLVEDVSNDALRWAAAIKQATEAALISRSALMDIESEVVEIFGTIIIPSYRGGGTGANHVPADAFESIRRLLAAGLARDEIIDAAYITAGATNVRPDNLWRFFCGVCWRKVDDRHTSARQIIEAQDSQPSPKAIREAPPEDRYALSTYYHLAEVCDGGLY